MGNPASFRYRFYCYHHSTTTERLLKLKEAKDEAEKEIQKFKESKEKYFQKFTKEQLEGSGSNTQLQQKKMEIMQAIKQGSQRKKVEVVKFLVDNVINVNTELEFEQRAFIEKQNA